MPELDKIKLLTDIPIAYGVNGFNELSSLLSGLIRKSYPRFTMGLFGDVGVGKTSLMLMIKGDLDNNAKILTLWIDALKYDLEDLSWTKYLIREIRLELELSGKVKSEKKWKDVKKSLKGLIGSTSFNFFGLGINLEKMRDYIWKDEESLYGETMNQLQEQLRRLLDDDPEFRIVVFINDLDRLSPKNAMELLASIENSILFSEGIIVVVGLSLSIIEGIITVKYLDDLGTTIMDFIQRIFQFTFNVPKWDRYGITELIDMLLQNELIGKDFASSRDILSYVVPLNPRGAKRFINDLLLINTLYQMPIKEMIVMKALSNNWHGFLECITSDYNSSEVFTDYVRIRDDPEYFKNRYPKILEYFPSFLDTNDPLRRFLDAGAADVLLHLQDAERYRRSLDDIKRVTESQEIPLERQEND